MTIYICDDSKSDLLRLNHHLQEYLSHQDQKDYDRILSIRRRASSAI